jgi:hypothetical protein
MRSRRVAVDLTGVPPHAFALIERWQRAAREQGWTAHDVRRVTKEMTRGDYENVLRVLQKYSRSGGDGEQR